MPRSPSTCLSLLLLLVPLASAVPPSGTLRLASTAEEDVYVQKTQGCAPLDYPDYCARAFRAADGTVTLMDSNSQGYRRMLRLPGESRFTRDCNVILSSGHAGADGTPQVYNNSVWLQSFWVEDGMDNTTGRVAALVHNEFHGERATDNPALCPSGVLGSCWYANVLAAHSTDGGAHFSLEADTSARAAIVSPTPYVPDGGRQGYVQMTNIVRNASDGAWYTLVLRSEVREGGDAGRVLPNGLCVWRSLNVSDPTAWRGWDGRAFTVASIDPYGPAPHSHAACVATGPIELRFTVVFSDTLACWLSVGLGATASGEPAFVYATSDDLFTWSDLAVLRVINDGPGWPQQKYASILDLDYAGADVNYVHVGATPSLYYTRLNADDDRDIVRQALEVVKRGP